MFFTNVFNHVVHHVKEGSEENEDIVKADNVDILHVEVSTRSMAQRMYVDVQACCCW